MSDSSTWVIIRCISISLVWLVSKFFFIFLIWQIHKTAISGGKIFKKQCWSICTILAFTFGNFFVHCFSMVTDMSLFCLYFSLPLRIYLNFIKLMCNFDILQVVITSININGNLLLIGSHQKEQVSSPWA